MGEGTEAKGEEDETVTVICVCNLGETVLGGDGGTVGEGGACDFGAVVAVFGSETLVLFDFVDFVAFAPLEI